MSVLARDRDGGTSEEAALLLGVSAAVGVRWFRSSGGMPPKQFASSSRSPAARSLTFVEREAIALERDLGYPSKNALKGWHREDERRQDLPI